MSTIQSTTAGKPTAFDELRYGYFDTAVGDVLKAIRGGTSPIGVVALSVCFISALSEIEWAINNQNMLQSGGAGILPGELIPMTKTQCKNLGRSTRLMFEGWLNSWIKQSGINPNCDAARLYGLRCALVHSSADSDALSQTAVKAWQITTRQPADHYSQLQTVPQGMFSIDMPEFLAESILAADRFMNDKKAILVNASPQLHRRISFLSGPRNAGSIRLIDVSNSLAWFDNRLSLCPVQISKDELAIKIRQCYKAAQHLVTQ